ncbi:arylsulfatase [Planctomycetota bacterium]
MNRYISAVCFAVVLVIVAACSSAATTRRRPNIVIVMTDDQGYGDLGCHGNPIIKTPSLDKFHSQAVRFTQFHVGTTCAPTRSGLMTGLNCNSTGVWHTIGGPALLRQGVVTLPELLRDNGYATGLLGKWHLGDDYPYRPHDRGFDKAVYHRGGGLTQVSDFWGNDYFDDTYLVNGKPQAFKGYCTDVFFDEAMKFITTHKDKPFFCCLTPNAPHEPFNVEKRYRDLYADYDIPENRRLFYGMITNLDENFQRLLDLLRKLRLEENTLVIFMTDNGTAGGMDQDDDQFVTAGYNAGMRGRKTSPYEGGHRVPFFVRYPAGNVKGGKDISTLASYVDVLPSLLDFCGLDAPKTDGLSLRSLMEGRPVSKQWKDRVLVADVQRIVYPIKWRLSVVMKDKWRLLNGRELYDLATDPEQRRDIAAQHPKLVAELRAEYEAWWDLCTCQFCEASTHIGSDQCDEVHMTTQELRNEDSDAVWNQGQVRAGQPCLGYWDIYAEKTGTYEIALRRWPAESGYTLLQGIQGMDINPKPNELLAESTIDWYQNGAVVDVFGAALMIDKKIWTRRPRRPSLT